MSTPRKIVFNVPSLLPDAGRRRAAGAAAQEAPPAAEAGPDAEIGEDARKLAMLVEVSQALTGNLNLQAGLYGVLEVLERRCGALRGAITLLEEGSGMLVVEAALGYPRPSARVRYRIGEGVTGMVAQSGTPAVVPRVSREPRFLHRAAERSQRGDEITFICVPIALDGGIAGTLGGLQTLGAGDVPQRAARRGIRASRGGEGTAGAAGELRVDGGGGVAEDSERLRSQPTKLG